MQRRCWPQIPAGSGPLVVLLYTRLIKTVGTLAVGKLSCASCSWLASEREPADSQAYWMRGASSASGHAEPPFFVLKPLCSKMNGSSPSELGAAHARMRTRAV